MAQFAQGIHPTRSKKKAPPVKIRHVGTDWAHGIETILLPKYKHLIPRAWLYGGSWTKAWSEKKKTFKFANGSQISFRAWEQEKDKHGGDDLDAIGLDEHGAQEKYQENAMRLIDRDGFLMAAMTPELGVTWEEDHVLEPPEKLNIEHYFFDTEHNPHLSKRGVEKIKAGIKDPQVADAKLRGQFVPLTGRVIPSWNPKLSVIPDDPESIRTCPRVFCIDLHTKTPSAALWAAWRPSQGRDGFDFVIYRTAKRAYTVNEWKQYIVKASAGEKVSLWLGDESERETGARGIWNQDSIIAAFNSRDDDCDIVLPIQQVEKGPGSFEAGIFKLRDWFQPDKTGKPRIFVFESCNYGIEYINGKPCGSLPWELKRYSFKKEQKADEETLREKVRKVNDHLIDDTRYLITAGPIMTTSTPSFDAEVYGG
jgi:hypothetical protein